MSLEAPWIDRPKPEGWPWIGWGMAVFGLFVLGVSIPAVLGGGPVFAILFLSAAAFVFTVISSTVLRLRYELVGSMLECRAGPNRIHWKIAEIERVEILDSHWARMQLMVTPQLLNRWNRPLLVVDRAGKRILLGPTNPEEMRDEILRRRDRLRGGSGALE